MNFLAKAMAVPRVWRENGFPAVVQRTRHYSRIAYREWELQGEARVDARHALKKIRASARTKGLFIDGGSHLGQAFDWFERAFPLADYDYVLIEPNPHCRAALEAVITRREGRIALVEAAASDCDGEARLYGLAEVGDDTDEGASIIPQHNSARYQPDDRRALTVPTFSLSDFLFRKADEYPVIVLKLDVESSEVPVLEHLLATGAANLVDAIYVAFHAQFMSEPGRSQWRAREIALQAEYDRRGIPFRMWW